MATFLAILEVFTGTYTLEVALIISLVTTGLAIGLIIFLIRLARD